MLHPPRGFLREGAQNTTHSRAVLEGWQREPLAVGPMWQSALRRLLTLIFKAETRIFKWLLKTEQSVQQDSLYIKYMMSPKKNTPTPHIPQWDYERQDKSVLQLSPPISLRHVSSPGTMKQWNWCTRTQRRKGCLATYSICLWTLLQSHLLGGFGNVAEHGQVGGIHALSSSRQEHSYLKL